MKTIRGIVQLNETFPTEFVFATLNSSGRDHFLTYFHILGIFSYYLYNVNTPVEH